MQRTRITCSPKTIVVAEVVKPIDLRMIGSVPQSAAAIAIRTTPGIAASRRIDHERNPRRSLDVPAGRRDASADGGLPAGDPLCA